MGRKKAVKNEVVIKDSSNNVFVIDADNLYNWTDIQKKFLEYYIQTKSLKASCAMSGYSELDASVFLLSFDAQKEIRRINTAMTQMQFQQKMATLNDIGGYLTSLLQGYTTQAEQLNVQEKMQVVDMLLKVHKIQLDAIKEPQTIIARDLNVDFSKLSIKTLKTLIDNYNSQDVDMIMNSNLSPEEIANIKSQGKEIAEIINNLQ